MKRRRVIWSQGAFLTPQHFQCQDDHVEEELQFRFRTSNFANWGLAAFQVDEARLANGFFALRYCAGVLPDGLAFEMPEQDDLPEGRAMQEHFAPTQPSLDVYLAVPEIRPQGRNFNIDPDARANTASTRYISETVPVTDANEGSDEQPLQLARKTFRLIFAGEPLEGFTAMRIAQVVRNETGAYELNRRFIPPLLDIAACDELLMLTRRQIEILSGKAGMLAARRRQKTREIADFTTFEVANFGLLHTANSYLPDLTHIWKVRRGHPDVLFRVMLRLAGALATFSTSAQALDLPEYDHNNLGLCFYELDERIRGLLDTVLPAKCVPIPLERKGKLIWSGRISDERCLQDAYLFLSVNAPLPVEELLGKFPKLARVSCPDEIDRLIQKSLPGISLRHTPSPPSAIPVNLDNQYFGLNQHGPLWEGVLKSRTISVFVPGDITDPKLELLAVLNN
jgi:type VI secretion system protein ImpJ